MEYNINKVEEFKKLSEKYILTILKIIDFSVIKNLIPIKFIIGIPIIKNYINLNKSKILECGVQYILPNKDEILNFSIDSLDSIESNNDDNISRKNCISNINELKNLIQVENTNCYEEIEILNLIIDIKNNAKKIDNNELSIIQNFMELLIMILEKIKMIFIN